VVVDVLATAAAWVVDVLDEVELFFLLPHAIPAMITMITIAMAVQNHHRLTTGFLPTGGGATGGGPANPGVRRWRARGPGYCALALLLGPRGEIALARWDAGGGGGGGADSGGYHIPSLASHHPGP